MALHRSPYEPRFEPSLRSASRPRATLSIVSPARLGSPGAGRLGTADTAGTGGGLDDDENPPPPPPRPPTPPPPEPIITYQPVAGTIKPRVFVIRNDGTGFEVLDTAVVESYLSGRRALASEAGARPGSSPAPGAAAGLAVDIREEVIEGADEEGTVIHSVLVQVPQRPPGLEPLALGGASLLQRYNPHAEELMPAFKRLAQLVKPEPGEPARAAGGVGRSKAGGGVVPEPVTACRPAEVGKQGEGNRGLTVARARCCTAPPVQGTHSRFPQ